MRRDVSALMAIRVLLRIDLPLETLHPQRFFLGPMERVGINDLLVLFANGQICMSIDT